MTRPAMPTPVWIDTDMGFDDLAAVLVVDQDAGWSVEGLSLVAGNAPLPVVEDNALRSAACFGWRFPVHAGCDKPLVCELVTAQYVLGADAMASAGRQLPPLRLKCPLRRVKNESSKPVPKRPA